MDISFGAKILTTPEQFYLVTDTTKDKLEIARFINGLKMLVENPVIDKFSRNDTVELKRGKKKSGQLFYINYTSPELKEMAELKKIHMEVADFSAGSLLETFQQITYPIMYKRGSFDKSKSLFMTYAERFNDAFGVSLTKFFQSLKK